MTDLQKIECRGLYLTRFLQNRTTFISIIEKENNHANTQQISP